MVNEVMLTAQQAHHNQPDVVAAIKAMSQIIISDPVAIFEIFKAYNKKS